MLFYRRRSLGKVFILNRGDGVAVAVYCYGLQWGEPSRTMDEMSRRGARAREPNPKFGGGDRPARFEDS